MRSKLALFLTHPIIHKTTAGVRQDVHNKQGTCHFWALFDRAKPQKKGRRNCTTAPPRTGSPCGNPPEAWLRGASQRRRRVQGPEAQRRRRGAQARGATDLTGAVGWGRFGILANRAKTKRREVPYNWMISETELRLKDKAGT